MNFPEYNKHRTVHADVKKYLKTLSNELFDLIVMDPPTFSNSKRMEGVLDIQNDHVELITDCLNVLTSDGILYFSTNYTKFILERDKVKASEIVDITRKTTPFDFENKLERQCFKIIK